jgi:hypothetical protein
LGELHLQLALVGAGAVGEDVQDQLGAGHGPAAQALLEIALLARRQVVIDDQEVGIVGEQCACELCELSLAHVPARVRRAWRLAPMRTTTSTPALRASSAHSSAVPRRCLDRGP